MASSILYIYGTVGSLPQQCDQSPVVASHRKASDEDFRNSSEFSGIDPQYPPDANGREVSLAAREFSCSKNESGGI
jgi:hypothetical protein